METEQSLTDKLSTAIAGLDYLIGRTSDELLISAYKGQKDWLTSIEKCPSDLVDALKFEYLRRHKLWAKSLRS